MATPHVLFRIVVPLLAALATLLLVELGLALLYPVPHSVEVNMYFEPDPHTGFRLRPGGVGRFQDGIEAVANRHGHRDDAVAPARTTGTARVLVLGDSFTVGAGVRQDEAWPQVLERLLRDRPGGAVEVVNTAVGGWGPFHYAQYFEYYGRAFDPDVVVVGFFVGNDTYSQARSVDELATALMGRRVTREAATSGLTRLKLVLYDRSHLARLILNRGPVAQDMNRDDCEDFTDDYLRIQQSRLYTHFRRSGESYKLSRPAVEDLLRIRGLARDLVVVLIPDENQINPALQGRLIDVEERARYDFEMPQSMLREQLEGVGIPVIDLLSAFRDDTRCLYINDTHWTPAGHELAAELVLRGLEGRLRR